MCACGGSRTCQQSKTEIGGIRAGEREREQRSREETILNQHEKAAQCCKRRIGVLGIHLDAPQALVFHSPVADPLRHKLMRCGGRDSTISHLDHDIHHIEVVVQLPLCLRDVSRVPFNIRIGSSCRKLALPCVDVFSTLL